MVKTIRIFSFSLLMLLLLNGCSQNNTPESLFDYKNSLVGDNSAIGNIVKQLPSGEYFNGFTLQTDEEPYGITLNYNGLALEETEQNYRETAVHSATYIFSLVQNAELITFNFHNKEYTITKEKLENLYGVALSEVKSEEELAKVMQKHLEDDSKLTSLFQ